VKRFSMVILCLALSGCAQAPLSGGRYVAMGSSFAAGPGVGVSADQPSTRCARSAQNYAHVAATRLGLTLVDVSCSGARTAHITGAWNEVAPQIDAVTADTVLVTMTIGGNDLGYIGNLGAASCAAAALTACPPVDPPSPARYAALDRAMREVIAAVHARAPKARIIMVEYPRVLPDEGGCARAPLSSADAALARATAAKLAEITAQAAAAEGAGVLHASELSLGHDACAAQPWMNGFLTDTGARAPVAYHPNAAGMAAIGDALVKMLTP